MSAPTRAQIAEIIEVWQPYSRDGRHWQVIDMRTRELLTGEEHTWGEAERAAANAAAGEIMALFERVSA